MKRACSIWALLLCAAGAMAQTKGPDFPPGLFADGGHYTLADLAGKAVVLFFYEQDDPKVRTSIPDYNKVVDTYKDKPVVFFAIASGDTLAQARAYASATGLKMIVFADNLKLMDTRYNARIAMGNAVQCRILGPDGAIVGQSFDPQDIDKAAAAAKWKYKGQGYDAKLDPVIDQLEWGQHVEAMRLLKPFMRNTKKDLAESAKKLYAAVQQEAAGWMTQADSMAAQNPGEAYDLYTKVGRCFAGDELGRKADAAAKKLMATPAMKQEMAARQAWDRLANGIIQATPAQTNQVKEFASEIARRYGNTTPGAKAAELVKDFMRGG